MFLALIVAALPTVVSLCELRCTASPVAASRAAAPACAGHAARQEKAPATAPSDERQGCARHVVLIATGNGTGMEVPANRAIVGIVRRFGLCFEAPDRRLERNELASADSSPPLGRSSDILRL